MESNTNSRLSFIQKFKNQPIFREKFLYTIWICCAFIMLGWTEAIFGPTFPDLRMVIAESLDTASWLFTASSAGFLIGSGITGVLYDRYDRIPLLIFSIIGTAIATAAIPWCTQFWLMLAVKVLAGMLAASLDTGGNTEIVSTWDIEADSFMQALHFCFSLGGMIAPFVAQPFLLETPNPDINKTRVNTDTNVSLLTNNISYAGNKSNGRGYINTDTWYGNYEGNQTFANISHESDYFGDRAAKYSASGETKIQYPYLISAILMLLTAVPFAVVYYAQPAEKAKISRLTEHHQPTDFYKRPLPVRLLLLGILSLLMFVYVGTDDVYAGFLMTFVISHLKWTKGRGSLATSLHWISFGLARLGCIFLVRFVKTSKLMVIFGICLVLSYAGLLISTLYDIQTLIWIFICFPGFSMSLIFPAIFTWTNENVVNVSGKISSMFLMSSSVGVMVFPPVFGHTMKSFTPVYFLYLLLGQSLLWVILFIATLFLTKYLLTKRVTVIEPEHEPLTVEMKQLSHKD